jgi:hypothetical protein
MNEHGEGRGLERVWKMHTLEMICVCVDSFGSSILRMVLWSTKDEWWYRLMHRSNEYGRFFAFPLFPLQCWIGGRGCN